MIEIKQGIERDPTTRVLWPAGRSWPPVRMTLAVILLSVLQPATLAKRPFEIKPPPLWVKPVSVTQSRSAVSNEASSGILYLLSDHQIRVTPGSTEQYYRRVKKLLNASSLEFLQKIRIYIESWSMNLV